jgi:cytochrome c553
MKKFVLLVCVGAVSVFATQFNCEQCHNGTIVKLNKFTPAQIIKQMNTFKKGIGDPMMVQIAKKMSEKEIKQAAQKYGKK